MKKITILALGLIYCLSSFSQDTTLNNIVTIVIPEGAKVLNKDKGTSVAASTQKSEINLEKINGNFYHLNGTILELNAAEGITQRNHLVQLKRGLDEMYGWAPPKNYRSEIKSINNYEALIVYYERENKNYYRFYCFNNAHTATINGVFELNKSDTEHVKAILNEMLRSIKFKR